MIRVVAPPPEPGSVLRLEEPPSFSVIVAAYQASDVIGEALDSLRRQTLAPLEIIVCDDGSTDDLDSALEPHRNQIRLIRKDHGGEASAKNAAASAASGDFVVILDADDTWDPTRLEALAKLAAARPDLDILTTDAYLVANGTRVRRCYSGGWSFAAVDQRGAILERNFIFGHVAVRRELLLAHGGFDESILWTTDWECWIRLILAGARAGCLAEPLATYRVRETSLSADRDHMLRGKIATLRKARGHAALEHDERDSIGRAIGKLERELAYREVRAAIAAHAPEGRERARAIALSPGHTAATRVRAVVLALAPSVSSWLIRRDAARWWIGAGGTRVRRTQGP